MKRPPMTDQRLDEIRRRGSDFLPMRLGQDVIDLVDEMRELRKALVMATDEWAGWMDWADTLARTHLSAEPESSVEDRAMLANCREALGVKP